MAKERPYSVHCKGGRTQQNMREQCDINLIVERAKKTGLLPQYGRQAIYMDTVGLPDYQASLNIVIEAERSFMSLPAKVRERFQNDPGKMIEFLENEENREEAEKLGLVEPKVKEKKEEVTTTTTTQTKANTDDA